ISEFNTRPRRRGHRMKRRAFIAALGSAAAWPVVGRAQQSGSMRRIACLYAGVRPAGPSSISEAFEERLAQLGWIKDQNIRIEYRYIGGQQETVSSVVSEAVGSGPDVLVTWGPPLSLAAKQATTQIPLIFIIIFDPIDLGLVSNLARPGGNVTGVT